MNSSVHEVTCVKVCVDINNMRNLYVGTRIIWHGSKNATVRQFTTTIIEEN